MTLMPREETSPEEAARPADVRPRRIRFQIGLRITFWLVAAVAVWMTVSIDRAENARLAKQIERLRPLARDLVVDDPTRVAAVKLDETWINDNRWDLFIPTGLYRVCLATRGVAAKGFPARSIVATIGPGRHRLILDEEKVGDVTRFVVASDGVKALTADETGDWAGVGWSSTGEFASNDDGPFVLARRRNRHWYDDSKLDPRAPADGLLLWVERIAGPDPPAAH